MYLSQPALPLLSENTPALHGTRKILRCSVLFDYSFLFLTKVMKITLSVLAVFFVLTVQAISLPDVSFSASTAHLVSQRVIPKCPCQCIANPDVFVPPGCTKINCMDKNETFLGAAVCELSTPGIPSAARKSTRAHQHIATESERTVLDGESMLFPVSHGEGSTRCYCYCGCCDCFTRCDCPESPSSQTEFSISA